MPAGSPSGSSEMPSRSVRSRQERTVGEHGGDQLVRMLDVGVVRCSASSGTVSSASGRPPSVTPARTAGNRSVSDGARAP